MRLQQSRHFLGCALIGASLLLSACGFQLRGTGGASIGLDALHVSAQDSHSPTRQQLVETLRSSGVAVNDSARYQLQLLAEPVQRRAVSYARRSTPAEYELTRSLVFQIADREGRPLIGPETLTVRRAYAADRDNLVASGEEEALLQREMGEDLVRQLMFRLSGISSSDLANREQAIERPAD